MQLSLTKTNYREIAYMFKKLFAAAVAATFVVAPLAVFSGSAEAKTTTQKKNERKGAAAKAKSKAKSSAGKKK
jgi:cytochrome bd-type quinol oxidase subunit 1